LASLLQAAEGEAERLTRAWLVTPCSAATIRQTEAAWAHAEATGALPPSPQGEHPEVIVLRFEAAEEADARDADALDECVGEREALDEVIACGIDQAQAWVLLAHWAT
jgi:hypothetical protein